MICIWWDTIAREDEQDAVLYHLRLHRGLVGVPWAFLPAQTRTVLERRVRIRKDDEGMIEERESKRDDANGA